MLKPKWVTKSHLPKPEEPLVGPFCPMPRSEKILPIPTNSEQRVRSCLCHYSRTEGDAAEPSTALMKNEEGAQTSVKPPVPRFRHVAHHAKPDPDLLDVQIGHKPPVPK